MLELKLLYLISRIFFVIQYIEDARTAIPFNWKPVNLENCFQNLKVNNHLQRKLSAFIWEYQLRNRIKINRKVLNKMKTEC